MPEDGVPLSEEERAKWIIEVTDPVARESDPAVVDMLGKYPEAWTVLVRLWYYEFRDW
jgi:hypothetical protein